MQQYSVYFLLSELLAVFSFRFFLLSAAAAAAAMSQISAFGIHNSIYDAKKKAGGRGAWLPSGLLPLSQPLLEGTTPI